MRQIVHRCVRHLPEAPCTRRLEFGVRSGSRVTPAGTLDVLTNRAQRALRVRPGDAGTVEVLLEPQRVGQPRARRRTRRLQAHVVVHCGDQTARRCALARVTAGRWISPPHERTQPRRSTAARCPRSRRRSRRGRSGRRRRRRQARRAAPPTATDDQVREAREQEPRAAPAGPSPYERQQLQRSTPSTTVSTRNAGHCHAPRSRQRRRREPDGLDLLAAKLNLPDVG